MDRRQPDRRQRRAGHDHVARRRAVGQGADRDSQLGAEGVRQRAPARFKFVVSALDAQEDPEIEMPDGNLVTAARAAARGPASAVVNFPLRRASSPLTMMSSKPSESWCGLS